MTKTEREFETLLKPVIEQLGYELYDVEYVKEKSDWYLRLYIDHENGIGLEDCEKVSNCVSDFLDEKDPIETSYILEVSSCGLERNLRNKEHFEKAAGKNIEVKLFKALNGEKQISGILKKFGEDKLYISNDESEFELNLADIASAKILFDWEE